MCRAPCPSPSPRVCPSLCPLHQWCHPASSSFDTLFSSCPRSFPASGTFPMSWLFSSDGQYWSFGFSISLSSEYSGLISLKMDWLDLLAVQGALRSLLQHHSSKASILWCSAFFMVQFSQPYVTTGKTTALTMWPFVGRETSLLSARSLGLSWLSRGEASASWFQGCSHRLQWFWSPRKESLSLFPLFPHLFPVKWWTGCHHLSFLNAEF